MNQKTSRTLIIITTLVTALIHLVLLNILLGKLDLLFTLNGLGYLALLAVFLYPPGFLAQQRRFIYLAFIGFTAVTIAAWVFLGDISDPVGVVTKLDEVVLIAALVLHRQSDT
jgi:Na+/melibiose symporter-like transporter